MSWPVEKRDRGPNEVVPPTSLGGPRALALEAILCGFVEDDLVEPRLRVEGPAVEVLDVDDDVEGFGQGDDVHLLALPAHRLDLLLAVPPDRPRGLLVVLGEGDRVVSHIIGDEGQKPPRLSSHGSCGEQPHEPGVVIGVARLLEGGQETLPAHLEESLEELDHEVVEGFNRHVLVSELYQLTPAARDYGQHSVSLCLGDLGLSLEVETQKRLEVGEEEGSVEAVPVPCKTSATRRHRHCHPPRTLRMRYFLAR